VLYYLKGTSRAALATQPPGYGSTTKGSWLLQVHPPQSTPTSPNTAKTDGNGFCHNQSTSGFRFAQHAVQFSALSLHLGHGSDNQIWSLAVNVTPVFY
jgi:hypothetical protein